MIPATYPSILDSSNRTKMLVYQVPSITGLTRWVDYIPVKSPTSESDLTLANTFANEGFILTSKVNDITGLVPFKDYVPIYLDSTATKAWSADNDGYIPMAELAGLLLDFTTGSLDSRINFSRTTNATVTNSAGVIAYAPHNLLTYSEQFDNAAWTVEQGAVVANNITAPNGTLTAEKYTENALAGVHGFRNTTAIAVNGKISTSIYLKNGTRRWVAISMYDGATYSVGAVVDLTTGLITQTFGTWDSTPFTVDAGDGWYRLVVTKTLSTSTFIYVCGCDSATALTTTGRQNRTGDGTSYFYMWGAQLEVGASPTAYNSTTVKNLLGYSELFDNAAWTKSNSFVQTNLLTYSEAFDNAAWAKLNYTASANDAIAPNGYQTADTITTTGAGGNIYQATSVTAGLVYTFSFYAKRGTATDAKYSIYNVTGAADIVAATSYYSSINSDTWTRVTVTFTAPVGCTSVRSYFMRDNNAAGTTFIWGAQLVQGSVAGDYRRTDAAALPVYYANHNGVICAEKLVESATTADHYIQQSATAGNVPYTYSCYLKAGERTNALVAMSDLASGNATAIVNLSTGVATSTVSGSWKNPTAQAIPVGNGYYRVSITATKGAGTSIGARTHIYTTASSYAGDGTSGIYIFGAQLSDSASLDPYVLNAAAAPTAAAYYGARFDYDPVTLEAKGLLIEEQRTNLLLNSVMAGGGSAPTSYTFTIGTGTSAPVTSVITSIGTAYYQTATAQRPFIAQGVSLAATTTYTISMNIESFSGSLLCGQILGVSGITPSYILNGVSVLNSTPLTTGKLIATFTTTTATTYDIRFGIGVSGAATGTLTFSCPQIEAGAFATSYIPTAASQVTRAADVATIQGSNFYSWYNQDAGSYALIADTNSLVAADSANILTFSDGTNTNRVASVAGNQFHLFVSNNSGQQASIDVGTFTSGVYSKLAAGYENNNFAVCLDNGVIGTDPLGVTPLVSMFNVGRNGVSATPAAFLNGHIKLISYYPQRLSNDVLKGLTA